MKPITEACFGCLYERASTGFLKGGIVSAWNMNGQQGAASLINNVCVHPDFCYMLIEIPNQKKNGEEKKMVKRLQAERPEHALYII